MSTILDAGLQGFASGDLDWTSGTWKVSAMALSDATAAAVRPVTGATNASPVVLHVVGHGFADGERVFVGGIEGNEAANGEWRATVVDADHVSLYQLDGAASVGSGAYGSGGYLVMLGNSSAGNAVDDFADAFVGDAATLSGQTAADGVLDASDLSAAFLVPADIRVDALLIWYDTGTESTSVPVVLVTGTHSVVVAADAAASATQLWVEPLGADLASGVQLTFSNGASAVTSAPASAGDRAINVDALADGIDAGNRAEAPAKNSGVPFTANGNGVNLVWNNGAARIARI